MTRRMKVSAWKNKYIGVNKYARSGKKLSAVKGIVVHWTANYGGTAMNHYNYFKNLKDRYASAHLFVDKSEALCIVPLNEICYHANDGSTKKIARFKPNANLVTIGVEMCVEKNGVIHPDTVDRTEAVVAELCRKYGLNPLTDVVRHYDITGKNCPAPWVRSPQGFVDFKKRVDALVKGVKPATPKPTPPQSPDSDEEVIVSGKIKILVDSLNLRNGASFDAPVIRTLPKDSTWKVYYKVNGMYNLGGNQFCSAGSAFVKFTGEIIPPEPEDEDEPLGYIGVVEVLQDDLNVREDASTYAPVVKTLPKGGRYRAYSLVNGMYNLGGDQWVYSGGKYVKFTPVK